MVLISLQLLSKSHPQALICLETNSETGNVKSGFQGMKFNVY